MSTLSAYRVVCLNERVVDGDNLDLAMLDAVIKAVSSQPFRRLSLSRGRGTNALRNTCGSDEYSFRVTEIQDTHESSNTPEAVDSNLVWLVMTVRKQQSYANLCLNHDEFWWGKSS